MRVKCRGIENPAESGNFPALSAFCDGAGDLIHKENFVPTGTKNPG
jgi:hypothetical protein